MRMKAVNFNVMSAESWMHGFVDVLDTHICTESMDFAVKFYFPLVKISEI